MPLPRLGGVAIFLSFAACMALSAAWAILHPNLHPSNFFQTMQTVLVPAALVFALGVWDDLRGVGPYVKFGVQAVAASMLYAGGLRIVNIPVLFGNRPLPWFVELMFTVIWVLAITNAFNLIDGLDGLAAGSALFSTMVAFVWQYSMARPGRGHDDRVSRSDPGISALQLQSGDHLPG